jgi:hypothetical protein
MPYSITYSSSAAKVFRKLAEAPRPPHPRRWLSRVYDVE